MAHVLVENCAVTLRVSREKERESTFGVSVLKPNQRNHSSESDRKKHPGELKKIRSKNKKIV